MFHADGPCLVLAGAGSGKTRVIIYRLAYLLERGIDANRILLVTFTNKAANEMIERADKLVGQSRAYPWAGTFHSIANKILRHHAGQLGYKNNFTILDSDDSLALIKMAVKEFQNEKNGQKFPSPRAIQSIISYARNAQETLESVLDLKNPRWLQFLDEFNKIADWYEHKKKSSNAMDFDDLLVNLLTLLNDPITQKKFASQFQYILVDEYQDTNKIQASIIKKLSGIHNNILAVGDDAQSIYSFRAADIQNIMRFEKDYHGAKIFKLETNYRSTQKILDLANDIISNNASPYKKELKTASSFSSTGAVKPILQPHSDQNAEAEFVVDKIKELLDKDASPAEIAVLFRASHHSQQLEMELAKAGIPYDYRGGLRFFERAHIKDVLAYLRIVNNVQDSAAWMRVLLHEEGIGDVGARKIVEFVGNVRGVGNDSDIEEVVSAGAEIFTGRVKEGWKNLARILSDIISVKEKNPAEMIDAIIESNYQKYLEAEYLDSDDRIDDIRQMQIFAAKYEDLDSFLAEASLQEGFRNTGAKKKDQDAQLSERVVLSTIHQAKGLEWEDVFVINLAGGSFPNERALKEDGGIEEERRLFYVAVTRAKKYLFLTYPMSAGGWGDNVASPSMFLQEISNDLLDDKSFLRDNMSVFNDDKEDITYIPENTGWKPKPGSFLREVEDL